jgi:hypothetical protein
MNTFNENKELIQEFSKTFDVGVVDIYNFIRSTQEENKYFEYAKGFENGLNQHLKSQQIKSCHLH